MKHIFIVNPAAGIKDSSSNVIEALKKYDGIIDYEVYLTTGKGDASRAVSEFCGKYEGPLRIYACGGDGTLNEVLNGIDLEKDVELACFPCGSGNDFVKYFENTPDFYNLDKVINAKSQPIDILKVDDKRSINIVNFGMDATVCVVMDKLRRKKIIGGKNAYNNAVIYSLLFARNNRCQVVVDGNEIHNGKMLLCAVANAKIYGGGYMCAPDADIQDGLFQLCMIGSMPLLKISGAVGAYKVGTHLENKKVKPYITYLQGKKVEVTAPKGIGLCLDGETCTVNHFTVELLHHALKLAIPEADKEENLEGE